MAGLIPVFPIGGGEGGGSGRATFTPAASPFVDDAARDTYFAANLNELRNSTTEVTTIEVGNTTEMWSGENQPSSYLNAGWITTVQGLFQADYDQTDSTSPTFIRNIAAARAKLEGIQAGAEVNNPQSLVGALNLNNRMRFTRDNGTTFDQTTAPLTRAFPNLGQGAGSGSLSLTNFYAAYLHFHPDTSGVSAINIAVNADVDNDAFFIMDFGGVNVNRDITILKANTGVCGWCNHLVCAG